MWGPLPPSRWLTVLLLALWLLLALYVVATGNALGYIILALVGLFVFLPRLLIWLGARRDASGDDDTTPTPGADR